MKTNSIFSSKQKNFTSRVFDAMVNNGGYYSLQGNVLRAQNRIRAFESVTYSEYDLRGLSKAEKEFMRENEMKSYFDYEGSRYYIFIRNNKTTGKKQLYAYEKKQWMNLNGRDFKTDWNYAFWLTIDTKHNRISRFNYEYRFNEILSFVQVW